MDSQKILKQKIEDLKEGDLLAFYLSDSFGHLAGYLLEYVTENAIKVNGDWIPKSQILSISYGSRFYQGVECKEITLTDWFDNKLINSRGKGNMGF